MQAKRGDAIAVISETTDYVVGQGRSTATRIELGIVTSITREGVVKAYKSAAYDNDTARPIERVVGYRGVQVIPTTMIPTADVVAVAKNHHFDGYPNQAKPFDSLEELRNALAPYRVDA